jgi:hypothetical protein
MPDGYTVYIENSAATTIRQLQHGDQLDVCKRIGALAVQSRPPGGIRMRTPTTYIAFGPPDSRR